MNSFIKTALFSGCLFPALLSASGFRIPFEGNPEVFDEKGAKISTGTEYGRVEYPAGVQGKGIDLRRHAYDQAGALHFRTLPTQDWRSGTFSFWFKPHWNQNDREEFWIFHCQAQKNFLAYFLKRKDNTVELTVSAPKQIQILTKKVFTKEKWTHVAFSWDSEKGEVILYIDGKKNASKTRREALRIPADQQAPVICLGNTSSDRFKANVGNGTYDDLRFYDRALTPWEIRNLALASDETSGKLEPASTGKISSTENAAEFLFSFSENVPPVPVKVCAIEFDGGNSVELSMTGASGRLAFTSRNGKKTTGFLESACLPDFKKPIKISLVRKNGAMECRIDGITQGLLPFSGKSAAAAKLSVQKDSIIRPPDLAAEKKNAEILKTAVLSPLEEKLWLLDDAERAKNGVRSGVTLNGYWRVNPVQKYTSVPDGKWGYMRVPGSFRSPLWQIYRDKGGKLESLNWKWQGQTLANKHGGFRAAWYQRAFRIPDHLKKDGSRFYLNFENMNGGFSKIILNGKTVDSSTVNLKETNRAPNRRRIDVTEHISVSGENLLTVFIDRDFILWEGWMSIEDHGEIALGNVWLESAPSTLSLKSCLAFPSFRSKNIRMRAKVLNPEHKTGKAALTFAFLRKNADKTFRREFELSGAPEQLVEFTEKWTDPVLWDSEHPELYSMNVSLDISGKTADTFPATDFGFRELWIENGEFRLNGNKMHMRMYSDFPLERYHYFYGQPDRMKSFVAHFKELNFNTVRASLGKIVGSIPLYLDECDRQGLYNLFPMPFYVDQDRHEYTKVVEDFLNFYGNRPSILMWFTDFNTCHYAWNQEPAKLNDTEYQPKSEQIRLARSRVSVAAKAITAFDPSREWFAHAGGNFGKVFGSMNYQSYGTPLQEQEDWPSMWSQSHTQPLMSVEGGFPYVRQWMRFDVNRAAASLGAEHAARYLGDSVYAKEEFPTPYFSIYQAAEPFDRQNANMLALSDLHYRRVVKAWRAYDVSAYADFHGGWNLIHTARTYSQHNSITPAGVNVKTRGFKPDILIGTSQTQRHDVTDYSQPDYQTETLKEVFAPLLVFLGGEPENFTEKSHAFWSEEEFRKSIVLVNDHTTGKEVTVSWSFFLNGTPAPLDSGRETVRLAPAEIRKLPVLLKSPTVLKRTSGELRITAEVDGILIAEDAMKLQFFPKHAPKDFSRASAVLYDPAGKTEAMLKKAGFPFRKTTDLKEIESNGLLIIGQDALSGTNPEFLKEIERSGMIERGLKILIFEQKQCNLANLVFESPSLRNAFIRTPSSPYIRGLEAEDFHDWRGSSDTVPEYVLSAEETPHYPRSKWKWGNGGIVSGNVIRKPDYGNFKIIVDSGFNLAFASLMELRKQHGTILFCQLDVTSRYLKDPAATRVTDNILEQMSSPHIPAGPVRTAFAGSDSGAKILDRMGVEYTRVSPNDAAGLNAAQAIILDAGGKNALRLISGRKPVILLPGFPLETISGVTLRNTVQDIFRASAPKDDPLFESIPDADLYFRDARKLPVLTEKPQWTVATEPALFAKVKSNARPYIILNVAPDMVGGFWNAEKISRIWSTIFNNLNIGLSRGLSLFDGERMRHNTVIPHLGEAVPENVKLKLDFRNEGKPGQTGGFKPVLLGKSWEEQGFTQKNPFYTLPKETPKQYRNNPYDGYAWYRMEVFIPESWKGATLSLDGGPIDDFDWTWFNGKAIGETTLRNSKAPWSAIRHYPIPQEIVKFGEKNVIEIRVFDRWSGGGIVGPLKVTAKKATVPSRSPYIDNLDFYDGDAFHQW